MHDYFGFGQAIRSELPVQGAIPSAGSGGSAITVRLHQPETDMEAPLYRRDGDDLIFSAPDAGTYRCNAQEITVSPRKNADPEYVQALLIATALPACLWMQGAYMLHAACVVPDGAEKAIAIVGASGAGKSTLAGWLLDRGAKLVGDDSIAIRPQQAGIMACGLPGGLFLRPSTGDERNFKPADPVQISMGAELGAIIILDDSDGEAISPLDRVTAMQSLLTHRHRPRIPAMLALQKQSLDIAAAIARNVPVLLRSRSQDSEGLTETELKAIWQVLEVGGQEHG